MEPKKATNYSDVQLVNYTLLSTLRTSLAEDGPRTRARFALNHEQAERLALLGPGEIQVVVAQLTHASLFVPRDNLVQLLKAPPALVPVLAAVRHTGTRPFVSRSPGRRSTDRSPDVLCTA